MTFDASKYLKNKPGTWVYLLAFGLFAAGKYFLGPVVQEATLPDLLATLPNPYLGMAAMTLLNVAFTLALAIGIYSAFYTLNIKPVIFWFWVLGIISLPLSIGALFNAFQSQGFESPSLTGLLPPTQLILFMVGFKTYFRMVGRVPAGQRQVT